jgi:hypothetical protein
MNMLKSNYRSQRAGEGGLPILIIVVLLIGGGFWWLFSNKRTAEKGGREFAQEAMQRLAVNHDLAFLESRLSPSAKMEMPPSNQKNLIETLKQLGAPAQPIHVEGKMMFESHFFDPKGFFTGQLNYPQGPGTLEIAISHPAGKWKLDSVRFGLGARAP